MSAAKKPAGDGPKMVTCYFCDSVVTKRSTRALPMGARVCRSHLCIVCGELVDVRTSRKTLNGEACCGKHLRYARDNGIELSGEVSGEVIAKLWEASAIRRVLKEK